MRFVLAITAMLLASCGGPEAPSLRIAAASDLRFALDEIAALYRQEHSKTTVDITYGSSGNFYTQIQNGAPFDIYFSADAAYPQRLAAEGLVLEGSEFLYAVGRIVLWSATRDVDEHTLEDPAIQKVAIANPEHAPYGRAAEAALKSLGLYDQIQPKLVYGENVSQTLQFVQSGGADVGIVALALVLAPTIRDEGRYWEIPPDSYPVMAQGGAILRDAKNPEAAGEFRDFMLSPRGRQALERYGFTLPGGR